jgi:hypothetical protein
MHGDVISLQAESADDNSRPTQAVASSTSTRSLVILGCSERKKRTSCPIRAIDRYDGPIFHVLRKHIRETPTKPPDARILSGRFGLITGEFLVPRYDCLLENRDLVKLGARVEMQLKQTLDDIQPGRVFVSVGRRYWQLIGNTLLREVPADRILVAAGGIGGRASQLAHWLRPDEIEAECTIPKPPLGEAILLGTIVRLTRAEVLYKARNALLRAPAGARRFERWYVLVDRERVAPKWLVSVLFDKPVARFRTADARRVLSQLGVPCIYDSSQ